MGDISPENKVLWDTAWSRLPLPRLLETLGDKWKRGADACPFCGTKHKFAVFQYGERQYFKCHSPSCVANAPDGTPDEIGYLALRRGLSRKDAAVEFLRLAVPELLTQREEAPPEPIKPPRTDAAENEPSRNPWHALWKRLVLTSEDRAKLRNKRGFDDRTIDLLGFKSNNEHNLDALMSLQDEFSVEQLIAEGIYKVRKHKEPSPSGQLLGWGRTGQKDKHGEEIWDITNPILIPYFDADGFPYYLRPHKGGVTKPKDPFADVSIEEDDDPEERPCASELYAPPGTALLVAQNDGMCVWTEGEFKAGVGVQCRIPIIATPGTSFLKNANFRRATAQLLDQLGVTRLVIIYDNEVKDDPSLGNYKKDPFDRYDVQVWAEYAQIVLKPHLQRSKGHCLIGWLPDEWRKDREGKETGKVDFDSLLARLTREHGLVDGTAKARRIFLKATDDAHEPSNFRELFPTISRRIIEWKLKRKFYQSRLLVGGDKEIHLADEFNDLDEGHTPIDRELATAFRDIIGCYYKNASVSKEERKELMEDYDIIRGRVDGLKATANDLRDPRLRAIMSKRNALRERLKGMPERVSNFTLRCDYRLHLDDGQVVRLVRVFDSKDRNKKDHKLVRLTASDLCGLRNFRDWILRTGDGVWHGGEKDLQNLSEDLDHQAYMRDIHQIVRVGYDKHTGIWFFGDKAYSRDGSPIYPDEKGIYWHDGFGYQLDADADEKGATGFIQGLPLFTHPHNKLAPLTGDQLDELGGVRGLFKTVAEFMFDSVGGYDGWVALGLTLAYAIAPELLKFERQGHPGVWFFGKLGQGKSFIMKLLMQIWGFTELEGILLNKILTDNGLARILNQYSCVPIFLDEARKDTLTDEKLAVIRGSFQRQAAAKATADYTNKVRGLAPFTTPMIGGESSSHDSATRSRFGHVQIAASRRLGDADARRDRILALAPHFYRIGDWLMSNRPKFAEVAVEHLRNWINIPEVRSAITDDRLRFVHGAAYAAMQAATTLFDINADGDGQFDPTPENPKDSRPRSIHDFHTFLLTYAEQAMSDVHEETFIVKFWEDVRSGVTSGAIKRKFFQCFHLTRKEGKTPDKWRWGYRRGEAYKETPPNTIPALLISIDDVFPAYEEAYRKRTGNAPPLAKGDVRRLLDREPYWIQPEPGNRVHRACDHNTSERGTFWAISLQRTQDPDDEDTDVWKFPFAEAFLIALHTEADKEP